MPTNSKNANKISKDAKFKAWQPLAAFHSSMYSSMLINVNV
jgi:hypothetical protein